MARPKPITSLGDLTPDPMNANRGNERGHGMLEDSLRELGAGRSILTDRNGVVIAGNKTLDVAASIGLEDIIVVHSDGTKLVVVQRDDLDLENDQRAKKLALADNRVGEANLEWDANILAQLQAEDPALVKGLWTEKELTEVLRGAGGELPEAPEAQVDRAAELAVKWGTALGQLWECGPHRIMCGDCTDRATVDRLMGGEKADVTLTDPPYGVGMEYGMHEDRPEENEGLVVGAFALGPDSRIWTPGLKNLARELAREPRAGVLAWNRKFSLGWPPHGCSWATVWEPILVTKPKARKLKTDHFEYMTDRITVGEAKLTELHPCPKAIELWCELLEGLTDSGMIVYDPFLGSGTTIIACQRLGRKGRGIDISAPYVAVSLQRLADMGLEPRLCADG